jgi:hypothetical protein
VYFVHTGKLSVSLCVFAKTAELTVCMLVDSSNDTLRILAQLQQPDIILNSKDPSTAGAKTSKYYERS